MSVSPRLFDCSSCFGLFGAGCLFLVSGVWCLLQWAAGRYFLCGLLMSGSRQAQISGLICSVLYLYCCISHISHTRILRVRITATKQSPPPPPPKICPMNSEGPKTHEYFFPAILGVLRESFMLCIFTHSVQHFLPLLIWLGSIICLFPGKWYMPTLPLLLPAMPSLRLVPTGGGLGIKYLLCPHNAVHWGRVLNRGLFFCYHKFWCPNCECFALSEVLPLDTRLVFF